VTWSRPEASSNIATYPDRWSLQAPRKRRRRLRRLVQTPSGRADVDLPNAVSILASGPAFRVVDGIAGSGFLLVFEPQVRAVLVGKDAGLFSRSSGNCPPDGLLLRIETDPEAGPSSFAANHPQDRRPVVLVGAPSPGFVGPRAGRVIWISMRLPFFPPRFDTSHRLRPLDPAVHPSALRREARPVPLAGQLPECDGAASTPTGRPGPSRRSGAPSEPPSQTLEEASRVAHGS
jgi:hypothetical protein